MTRLIMEEITPRIGKIKNEIEAKLAEFKSKRLDTDVVRAINDRMKLKPAINAGTVTIITGLSKLFFYSQNNKYESHQSK